MTFQGRIIRVLGFSYLPKSKTKISIKNKTQMFCDPQVMRYGYMESYCCIYCLVAF